MAQVIVGNKITSISGTRDTSVQTGGTARLTATWTGVDGRVIALGGWVGWSGVARDARWVAYLSSPTNPGPLVAQSDVFSINASETNFEKPVTLVSPGYGSSQKGAIIRNGQAFPIALIVSAGLGVVSRVVTISGQHSGAFLRPDAIPSSPPNPYSHTQLVLIANGSLAWYMVVEENRIPVITPSSPAGPVSVTTPTFSGTVVDQDRIDGYNDYPARVTVRVWEDVGGAYVYVGQSVHNLANPGAGVGSVPFSVVWGGPTLENGKTYAYTLEIADEIGGVSGTGYAGYNAAKTDPDGSLAFTVAVSGIIAPTSPSGKVLSLQPTPFSGLYTHPTSQALDTSQVRILKENDAGVYTVIQTSAVIDHADVTSGNSVSLSWATLGFSDLEWGKNYAAEWKIVDALGQESEWISRTYFHTNHPPQQASGVNPTGEITITSRPQITFSVLDEDDEPEDDLTGQVEISGPMPLSNGGFDTDLAGWTYTEESASFTQTITRVTVDPASGAGNLSIAMSAVPAETISEFRYELADELPVVPGNTYSVTGKLRRTTGGLGGLAFVWFDSGGSLISESKDVTLAPTLAVWGDVQFSAEAPALASYAKLSIKGRASVASQAFTHEWDALTMQSGVRYIRDAVYLDDNVFGYQTVEDDLPEVGSYSARARGVDLSNNGAWSAPSAFDYAVGVTGSFTAPTVGEVIASSQPLFSWTITDGTQERYRITIDDPEFDDTVYDSGWIAGSDTNHIPDAGYLGNSTTYIAYLWVDDGGAENIIDFVSFKVTFISPAALDNFQASPSRIAASSPSDDAIILTWNPIETSPENVESIEIWMDDGVQDIRIAQFVGMVGAGATSFTYPFPRAGVEIQFRGRQIVKDGVNTRPGLWNIATARIDMRHVSLVSTLSPAGLNMAFSAWQPARKVLTQRQEFQLPAGGRDYIEVPGLLRGRDLNYSAQLYDRQDESGRTSEDDKNDFEALFDSENNDIFCLRDPRGGKYFCRFLGDPSITYGKGGVRYTIDFQARRVAYVEGA